MQKCVFPEGGHEIYCVALFMALVQTQIGDTAQVFVSVYFNGGTCVIGAFECAGGVVCRMLFCALFYLGARNQVHVCRGNVNFVLTIY